MGRPAPKRPTGPVQLMMPHITKLDWKNVYDGIHNFQVYVYGELLREAKRIFGLGSDVVVVATWTKPRSDDERSLLIPDPGALRMVVRNVDEHRCTNLKFRAQLPQDGLPKPGDLSHSHEDLFQ